MDDQALARAGLRMVLESQPDMRIIGERSDGAEAIGLVRRLRPTVAILDVRMPRVDGLEATRRIVAAEPATRILILTTFDPTMGTRATRHRPTALYLMSGPQVRGCTPDSGRRSDKRPVSG